MPISAMYRHHFKVVVLVCVLACLTQNESRAAPLQPSEEAQISQILGVLESCPTPTKLRKDDATARGELLTTLHVIDQYPSKTIRVAVKRFLTKHPGNLDESSKIVVLNRLVFAVPQKEPPHAAGFHCWGISSSDPANYMRPLAVDARGEIIFEGEFLFYIGAPYLALEEFDYFQRRFGRRGARSPDDRAKNRSRATP
jgi:hypothetical protein